MLARQEHSVVLIAFPVSDKLTIVTNAVPVAIFGYTTKEQVFIPGHLSRLPLGPGQKVAFVPGPMASRASGGIGAFCPGWSHQPGQKKDFLSRLLAPPGTKGPFCPGWCYQPGQKAPPHDSSKGSYSILSHVYYLGELARKPCARQEILGSNPVVCNFFFNVRHLLSRFLPPGTKTSRLLSRNPCPGSKTGTKASLEPGQKADSVLVRPLSYK